MKDALGDRLYESGYPSSPGYKEPTTSKAAATSMVSRQGRLQRAALAALAAAAPAYLTADEIAERCGETVLAMRPRITELAKAGKIIDTGYTRKNVSGKMAKLWRLP